MAGLAISHQTLQRTSCEEGRAGGGDALPAGGALAPLGAGMPAAQPLAREEYVQKHKPRMEFQPWSTPAFDDRAMQSPPELYCMASGTTEQDTTYTCATEQGTKTKISIPVCVAIARDGPAQNPYRAPGPSGSPASLSPHHLVHLSHRHMHWLRMGNAPWGRSRRRRLTQLASKSLPGVPGSTAQRNRNGQVGKSPTHTFLKLNYAWDM